MQRTIKLKFFQDEATGDYGVSHVNTINCSTNGFNAFWNGIGIFHDVFEHSFEHINKYFTGDNAMNVGGEVAAMGASIYLYENMGLAGYRELTRNSVYTYWEQCIRSTDMYMAEAVYTGYCEFGDTLNCAVPYQKPLSGTIEDMINEHWARVKNYKLALDIDPDSVAAAQAYRKSITLSKLQRLYRYGFNMAECMIPYSSENSNTLIDFIEFFNDFCNCNSAEDLTPIFDSMEIRIKTVKGQLKWTCRLISKDSMVKDILVKRADTDIMEQVYSMNEDY